MQHLDPSLQPVVSDSVLYIHKSTSHPKSFISDLPLKVSTSKLRYDYLICNPALVAWLIIST